MKNLFYLVSCLFLAHSATAQHDRCGQQTMQNLWLQEAPERAHLLDHYQQDVEQVLHNLAAREENAVVTIPVVFHVIHSGEAEGVGRNLSMTRLQSQLDILNKDFRRLNTDASSTPAQFLGVAADCEIQFCLATKDANGNATTGVTRHSYPTISSNSYIENTIKPQTYWQTSKYLNIWSVEIPATGGGGQTLGYAYLPTNGMVGSPQDGLVLHYPYTGVNSGAASLGRTATHEIGHYLGLLHPWGQNEDDCTEDDGFTDTPKTDSPTFGCLNTPTKCSNVVMASNFMDYQNDNCMNVFTTQQKNLMRGVLTGAVSGTGFVSRAALVANSATACTSTTTCTNVASSNFQMGFEQGSPINTWTVENTNNDTQATGASAGQPATWVISGTSNTDFGAHTGSQYATYFYNNNATSAANDWLFSPCLYLESGRNYTVSFWYAVGSSSGTVYPEKLKFGLSTSASSTSTFTLLQDLGTVTNAYPNYTLLTKNFTVGATGNYNLAFHCYSAADQYALMIDDINMSLSSTSTNTVSLQDAFTISPNPFSDLLAVTIKGTTEKGATLTVSDVLGRTLSSQVWQPFAETTYLDFAPYPNGVYFITLKNGSETITRKAVLNK